jgi:hypothetical protein
MKRSGPSSPQGKSSAKKHRGEQDSGKVASKVNWMAPVTVRIADAKPTTASTSPQDPCFFIHIESSCMYYYPYES